MMKENKIKDKSNIYKENKINNTMDLSKLKDFEINILIDILGFKHDDYMERLGEAVFNQEEEAYNEQIINRVNVIRKVLGVNKLIYPDEFLCEMPEGFKWKH